MKTEIAEAKQMVAEGNWEEAHGAGRPEVLIQYYVACPVRLLAPFQFRIYGTLTDFQRGGNLYRRFIVPPHQFNFPAALQRQNPHLNHPFRPFSPKFW